MKNQVVLGLAGVGVFIISLACGVNVETYGIPTLTNGVPEITDLVLRYEGQGSNRIVYQDFYFFDPDGDAEYIKYELIRVIPDSNVEVEDGDKKVTVTTKENARQYCYGDLVLWWRKI